MSWTIVVSAVPDGRSVVLAAGLAVTVAAAAKALRGNRSESRKRGVLVRSGAGAYRRGIRLRRSNPDQLTLAGIPVPPCDETKHFKVIGATGTGKSTAIRELLETALARGDRAVIADPDGSYSSRFFNRYRGDVLLNPFESNSMKWDVFAEVNDSYDADQLASALIPAAADASASEWRGYARTFLGALIKSGRFHSHDIDSAEFWRLVAQAPCAELQAVVAGTSAQPFLEPENARMFGSIRSVTVSSMAAFEYVQAQRAAPFSVRAWTRDASAHGALFIPYRAGQIAALRSLIATWFRLAIIEAMNAAEDIDQRLWFVIDELDALGAIDGLKDALARLRKFGGRCVLGFQSIAQVSGTYGAGDAQTIVENCGNTLILRCSSSEHGGTSQFASRLIGDREVIRRQISRTSDRDKGLARAGGRRSKSVSEQHVIEPAVLPSEIEQLPDLAGFFKSASSPDWLKVSFGGGSNRRRRP